MDIRYALLGALLLPTGAAALQPQVGLSVGFTSRAHPHRPWDHFFVALDGSLGFLSPARTAYGLPNPFTPIFQAGSGENVWDAGARVQGRLSFGGRPGIVLGGFAGLRDDTECGRSVSAGHALEAGVILEKDNIGPRLGLRSHGLGRQLRFDVTAAKRPEFSVSDGNLLDIGGGACPFGYLGRPVRDQAGQVIEPSNVGSDKLWLQRAHEEHGAVASFVVLAQQLAALGAPRALVGRVWRAAAEEAGHALAAYARAGTRVVHPLALPSRPIRTRRAALTRIAHEALWDGVVNEGLAADELARQRDAAREDRLARHLDRVLREERTHCDLNADVWRWCQGELAA